MDASRLEHYRDVLTELQSELVASLRAEAEDAKPVSPDRAIGRLTRQDAMLSQQMALELKRRNESRLEQVKKARALDPLSAIVMAGTGYLLYFHHQFDVAIEEVTNGLELDPSFPVADLFYCWNYYGKKEYDRAINHGRKAVELVPLSTTRSMLGCSMAAAGKTQEAESLLRQMESEEESYVSPYFLAALNFHLDHPQRGQELIEKAYKKHDNHLCFVAVDPLFDAYHDQDWYREIVSRLNLAETDTRIAVESGLQLMGDLAAPLS